MKKTRTLYQTYARFIKQKPDATFSPPQRPPRPSASRSVAASATCIGSLAAHFCAVGVEREPPGVVANVFEAGLALFPGFETR